MWQAEYTAITCKQTWQKLKYVNFLQVEEWIVNCHIQVNEEDSNFKKKLLKIRDLYIVLKIAKEMKTSSSAGAPPPMATILLTLYSRMT